MPNIFAIGSGAFGQTLYTWNVYYINTVTTYTVKKVLVLLSGDQYYAHFETGLDDVFGMTKFYLGDGVYTGSLQNAVAISDSTGNIGGLFAEATTYSKYYVQPEYDYLNDTGDNIFAISRATEMGNNIYMMIKGYAEGAVPVLASAITPDTVSATASTPLGWNDNDYYYYFDLSSTSTQSKGSSTGSTVTSYDANAYPVDGIQGNRWYTRQS